VSAPVAPYAVQAAERGEFVFPCEPGGKRPTVPDHQVSDCRGRGKCLDGHLGWEQLATSDPARVARYWPSPWHNIGVACGPSGYVVLDLDTAASDPAGDRMRRAGSDVPAGARNLGQIHRDHGQPWAETRTVRTRRGGWHLVYAAPDGVTIRNSQGRVAEHIDVRGDGGYIIGAGSAVSGCRYEVLADLPVAPLPRWLIPLLLPPPRRAPETTSATTDDRDGDAREAAAREGILRKVAASNTTGDWSCVLYWGGCRYGERSVPLAETLADLLAAAAPWNAHEERRATGHITNGWREGAGMRGAA
jgi:hypothetical protein